MRILCLTDFPISPGHRWFWNYVPGNQDEITFLHTRTNDRFKKWGKLLTSYPAYLSFGWQALKEARSGSYDLVVAWESDTGLPLALFRKMLGINSPPLVVLTFSVRGPAAHFLPLLRFAVRGVDFMTVPTHFEQGHYAALLGFPQEKILYCPYGTYDMFRDLPPGQRSDFVFSGGRSERDYKTLFAAVAELPIPFVINARPFNLNGLPIPSNVTANNLLPMDQFRDLNWRSRFVVVPVENVKQAAGISSVLYAMSAGKTVIASDVPGLHDYITEGETGLFVPSQDPLALRQAIQHLWDDPQLASRMGQRARQVYLERYTFDALAQRVVQTLHDIPMNTA